MKKKLTVWLLLAAMVLSLAACGAKEEPQKPEAEAPQEEVLPSEEKLEETPEAPAEPEAPEAKPEETPAEPQAEEKPEAEQSQAEPEKPEVQEPQTEEPQAQVPADGTLDLAVVRDAMITTLGISDPFMLETEALLNLYGITADLVKQSASFVTMSGTFPDEIIMVEAVDEAAASTIAAALQTRLDEVMVQSQSYDPDNYAAAQACEVRTNGLYVSLLLSPKQAEMSELYLSYVG